MANRIPILRNPIVAAVIDDLDDVDAVQRHLDSVRAQIAENSAIYADAAALLPQAGRRLAEALFAAAARQAPPESEQQQKTQQPPALPDSELEPDEDEEELDLDELVAALAAEVAEVVAGALQELEEEGEVVVGLEGTDPAVGALAADYLDIAVRVERSRQNHRILVQADGFLVVVRAVAVAITRAHLLLTIAAAYALAYAVSGGAVVPGAASLLRISALVMCFLFGVPVVGNLA